MDKTETRISRGAKADSLMADPVMVEARAHIDAELWRLFKSTSPTDTDTLTQVRGMQYMHEKYLSFLRSAIQDGKLAALDLERKKKSMKERLFG